MTEFYAFADETHPEIDLQIRALLRNGLQGPEIRDVDGTNISEITEEKAREVRNKLDANGLVTWSIGSPIGKSELTEDPEVENERLKRALETAGILGAERIRIFSFWKKDLDPELIANEVIDRLGTFAEIAAGTDILLCHENEKGIFGDNAARCRMILDSVPEIAAVFDPANFVQVGQETLSAWALLHDRVDYMHIKDALSSGDVVPPGLGEGHVEEIAKAYLAQGGTRFTIEPHLFDFGTFKALETTENTSILGEKYYFRNSDEAFDEAVRRFRALIG